MKSNVRGSRQLGEVIRQERRSQGLTQAQLSAITNLRPATISKVESGDPGAKSGTLFRIFAALNIEIRIAQRESGPSIEDIF